MDDWWKMKIRLISTKKDELRVIYKKEEECVYEVLYNEENDTIDVHVGKTPKSPKSDVV